VVNEGTLILKWWHLAFNPEKEIIRLHHLCVLLQGFPLTLWNLEAFKLIRNAIGKFLHVNSKQMGGFDHRMGKLLVELDTFEGFPKDIEITW